MVLNQSRQKIDALDYQLLELLAQRLEICKEISDYKRKNNLPIQDQEREKEILRERVKAFKEMGFDDETFITKLFEVIIKKSRDVQQ